MDLWERFKQLNPTWDRFKFMNIFKRAIYHFFPVAEKLAPEPDLRIPMVAYLHSIMDDLRKNCKKHGRANDRVLKPVQKIAPGIMTCDPAYLNYATAIVAMIQIRPAPFTQKQKAWLLHRYGVRLE